MTRRQLLLSGVLTVAVAIAAFVMLRPSITPPATASNDSTAAAGTEVPRPVEPGDPGHWIRIPSIDLVAPVREMFIDPGTPGGAVPAPSGPDLVGWYRDMDIDGGGDQGLLLGHVNWRDGSEGVFARLGEVVAGDLVEVQDGTTTRTYRINSITDVNAFSTKLADVLGEGGEDSVTLITCSGPYLWDAGMYSQRTIVNATLVEEAPQVATTS